MRMYFLAVKNFGAEVYTIGQISIITTKGIVLLVWIEVAKCNTYFRINTHLLAKVYLMACTDIS